LNTFRKIRNCGRCGRRNYCHAEYLNEISLN
jgi:hypothetical protein